MEASNHIIQIKPWEDNDLDLLFLINAPEMMQHLGGPESKEQILKRHKRYLELGNRGRMFSIKLLPELDPVGWVLWIIGKLLGIMKVYMKLDGAFYPLIKGKE
jgi:hypothetical protein